jgi:16S rRNA (guanine966-N2)-methyltransferase
MKRPRPGSPVPGAATDLRIIGGDLRRQKLEYHGDPRTRPMKDRVREAVFNLVEAQGTFALDLFAGTGALGLEAISRGAASALFIERHFPTAKLIEQNAQHLNVAERCHVLPGSAFVWSRRLEAPHDLPWLVFCCPPYEFYVSRGDEMLDLIGRILAAAPAGSTVVVESDHRFDPTLLPDAGRWHTREYLPAVISIWRDVPATVE